MTTKHQELMQRALALSNTMELRCNLYVNRRNGYYAIDKYSGDNGTFIDSAFIGNYKECMNFFDGMWEFYFLRKPF